MQNYCLVCDSSFSEFESYGIPKKLGRCPNCGSKGRHRSLAIFLQRISEHIFEDQEWKILEVGPSKSMTRNIVCERNLGKGIYTAIDIRELKHHRSLKSPHMFKQASVYEMDFAADSFDLVLCNNLLPFLSDSPKAIQEMKRCLKPNGLMLLNTPIYFDRLTRSAAELKSQDPEKYTDLFLEENGDAWEFGEDFLPQLRNLGLELELVYPHCKLSEFERNHLGVRQGQEFLFAAHEQETIRRFSQVL